MPDRTVHLRIIGRVQGVGFRFFVEDEATARRLNGWVRNRRDGTVEAALSGPAEAVSETIAACREGPPAARVTGIEISEYVGPPLSEFSFLPTE